MASKKPVKKTSSSKPATKTVAAKATPKTTKTVAASKTTAAKKPARKASAKTVVKTAPKTTAPVVKSTVVPTETSGEPVRIRKSYVALVIIILLIGVGLYFFRGLFVAAVVNGQPISRLEVIRQTEQQSGKATLDTLERNVLIEQEAKKQKVTVSDKEVTDEINKLKENLKAQGQTMDQVLAAQGMSESDLSRLIRLDKLVQKMVGKDVKVSDAEVNDYLEKNKESLPTGDEATLKKQIKAQLVQQKTNDKVRTWLAGLQKNASIVRFVQY